MPEENTPIDPITAARAELAAQAESDAPKGVKEADIAEKVKAGLTRDQAIEAIKNQAAYDAAQKSKK